MSVVGCIESASVVAGGSPPVVLSVAAAVMGWKSVEDEAGWEVVEAEVGGEVAEDGVG